MANKDWSIKGIEYGSCNCDWGCPCQFNALPTHGTCEAMVTISIDKGHHGDVSLDGVVCGFMINFPNPIHEGNGTHQPFIDSKASPEQVDALTRILRGEDTDEMATHFAVYSTMSTTQLDPIIAPIDVSIDIEAGVASVKLGDIAQSSCEPIRNATTNAVSRAQIRLPEGFEYTVAEMTNSKTKATGELALDHSDSYGQMNELHMTNHGIVR